MEVGGGVYGGSDQMTDLIQNSESNKLVASCSSDVDLLDSLWIPRYSSSSSFHATPPTTMLYDTAKLSGGGPSSALTVVPILQPNHNNEHYSSTPEKKRRLRVDQVEYLEKNFEVENKLEPEKKIQLAKDIGLQPRQVAIWFQNRRARYKTKQLEKDYDHLKSCYDRLVVDYDLLKMEKDKLNDQVIQLTNELKSRQETITAKSKPTSPITSIHPSAVYTQQDPQLLINNHLICSTKDNITMTVSCKQEGASLVRSDVFDSESSPHCTTTTTTHHAMGNNNNSHLLDESANSSPLINHELAEQRLLTAGFLLDEDHQLSNIDLCLLPLPSTYDFSPKNSVEDPGWCYEYDDDLPASANNNSCNLGLPAFVDIDHQHCLWSWLY